MEKNRQNIILIQKSNRLYNKKVISKLKVDDKLIEDPKVILHEQQIFYEQLYSSTNEHIENSIQSEFLIPKAPAPKLTENQKTDLDQNITEQELQEALKSFQNNKSPGNDGIPYEFYKTFWKDIALVFHRDRE